MKYRVKRVLERLVGPTGSIVLHVILFLALVHFVVFDVRDLQPDVEVQIMELTTVDLDELLDDLIELPDLDDDFDVPDVDIDVETDIPDDLSQDIDEIDFNALDAIAVESPLVIDASFTGRLGDGRERMRRQYGGRHAEAAERAALRALEWLRANQEEDGSWRGPWRDGTTTAFTGLALLSFLAHGETTQSERYGRTVTRAIRYLVRDALNEDGSFRFDSGHDGGVYEQGIATYALTEAAALTRIPEVVRAMEKSVGFIVQGQRADGGFDYRFALEDGRRIRCTSVAAWMAQALKAAYLANANVPGLERAMELTVEGLKLNFNYSENLFYYAARSRNPSMGQTAPGTLSMQLLGQGNSPEVRGALRSMSDWEVDWQNPPLRASEPFYHWYYATQVYFHAGGTLWERWVDMYPLMMIRNQNEDGSWTLPPGHGRAAARYGPIYATTFGALSLMVYYRYLPTFQPIEVEQRRDPREDDVIIEII